MLPTGSFLFTSIFRWGTGYRSLLRPSSLVASGIALLLSVANPSGNNIQQTRCMAPNISSWTVDRDLNIVFNYADVCKAKQSSPAQLSFHDAPIFRLLLKIAVSLRSSNVTLQIFGWLWPQHFIKQNLPCVSACDHQQQIHTRPVFG